tara:strand:+ start:461 stop:703 length:243 start_codon:yes stop_codon:yes gene_type:complete
MKKLSMYDMAMKNIRLEQRSYYPADVKEGDIVTVIGPWVKGQDYQGLVVEVSNEYMILYHNDKRRKITWPRRVKCNIIKL